MQKFGDSKYACCNQITYITHPRNEPIGVRAAPTMTTSLSNLCEEVEKDRRKRRPKTVILKKIKFCCDNSKGHMFLNKVFLNDVRTTASFYQN